MALLADTDRARVWRGFMRYLSTQSDTLGLTKADLRAAIDATDSWIDTNAAAYNLALPTAARTSLSATQKTLLFCAVALMRVGPAVTRAVFGEVD